jgi:hypothetical protein
MEDEMEKVMERHGMLVRREDLSSGAQIIIAERVAGTISMDGCVGERHMSPEQARYLASKLYRLARRIDKRVNEGG